MSEVLNNEIILILFFSIKYQDFKFELFEYVKRRNVNISMKRYKRLIMTPDVKRVET